MSVELFGDVGGGAEGGGAFDSAEGEEGEWGTGEEG